MLEAMQALEAFRAESTPLLRAQDRLLDYRDGRPEVRTAIANAERFLELAALVSVLLGGVAVAMAARRFVARRLDAVALMKCLGLKYREVLALHLVQLLLLVAVAAVLGSVVLAVPDVLDVRLRRVALGPPLPPRRSGRAPRPGRHRLSPGSPAWPHGHGHQSR